MTTYMHPPAETHKGWCRKKLAVRSYPRSGVPAGAWGRSNG